MKAGQRVRISGLVSKPELNGTVAIVLAPRDEEEEASLKEAGRLNVTGLPAPMRVKVHRSPGCDSL